LSTHREAGYPKFLTSTTRLSEMVAFFIMY
jgi:hypothetical protein